jgi:hypothetical protein
LSGIIEAVFGLVISFIFVVIGGIIIWALFPINAFMAIAGIVLLIAVAIIIVAGFAKSNSH